jgi:hypothetical protein
MDTLTLIKSQINELLAQVATDRAMLQQREREIAEATEQLHQDAAVRAAWLHGGEAMRGRVVALVDHQLSMLGNHGACVTVLTTLRRTVQEVEA